MQRTGHPILEEARGRGADIAWPRIGPGAALRLSRAGGGAALAGGIGGKLKAAKVAADTIDPELDRLAARGDDIGTANARDTAACGHRRRDARLEPADRGRILGYGIRKGPGPAARVAIAAGGALRRVAGAQREACIVRAEPVEADLGLRRAERD